MLPKLPSGKKAHRGEALQLSGRNSPRRDKRRNRAADERSEQDKRMERKNSRKRNMLDNSHLLGMSSSRRSISNLGHGDNRSQNSPAHIQVNNVKA